MATPSRFPQGVSVNAPWQFFGGMGLPNPFYYHQFADDFDEPPTSNGWTVTSASTGTAALTAGDGGIVTLTTAATLNDFEELQRTAVGFQPVAGKKLYFVARISLSDITASAFVAGLMPITATPFTNPANGIWISKASGGTQLVLNVANNSVVTSTNFPTTAYTLANNTTFDVGIYVASSGFMQGATPATVLGAVGPNLVGYIPQSGTGAAGSTNRSPNIASTAPLLTTVQTTVLAPTLALQAGAAAAKTMAVDFVGAFRER